MLVKIYADLLVCFDCSVLDQYVLLRILSLPTHTSQAHPRINTRLTRFIAGFLGVSTGEVKFIIIFVGNEVDMLHHAESLGGLSHEL